MTAIKDRPRFRPTLNRTDIVLEAIGWVGLVAIFFLPAYYFDTLPELIPSHYDISGKITSYGSKSSIWIRCSVAGVLFIGLTWLNRYPHVFNYPDTLTEENAPRLYTLATKLLRWVKTVIIIAFLYLTLHDLQQVFEEGTGISPLFVPLLWAFIMIPTIIFIVRSFRDPKKPNND